MITKEAKQNIVKKYGHKEGDTGSPEVQVGLLTEKIHYLTSHLGVHKKDHSSRRGLLRAVSLRRRLLTYLKRRVPKEYKKITKDMGLS